jgi:hypothetical protein
MQTIPVSATVHTLGICMCRACLYADNVPPEIAEKIEQIWRRTELRRRQLEAIIKPMYASLLYATLWVITAYLLCTRYAIPLTPPEYLLILCVNYIIVGGIYYGLLHGTWWIALPAIGLYISLYF